MAEMVVLEFSAPNAVSIYHEVNRILGWDGTPDSDAWPDGMISHVAGESGDTLVVLEVWESQQAQHAFMESKLGPAFAQAQVPEPTRVEWLHSVADIHSDEHRGALAD